MVPKQSKLPGWWDSDSDDEDQTLPSFMYETDSPPLQPVREFRECRCQCRCADTDDASMNGHGIQNPQENLERQRRELEHMHWYDMEPSPEHDQVPEKIQTRSMARKCGTPTLARESNSQPPLKRKRAVKEQTYKPAGRYPKPPPSPPLTIPTSDTMDHTNEQANNPTPWEPLQPRTELSETQRSFRPSKSPPNPPGADATAGHGKVPIRPDSAVTPDSGYVSFATALGFNDPEHPSYLDNKQFDVAEEEYKYNESAHIRLGQPLHPLFLKSASWRRSAHRSSNPEPPTNGHTYSSHETPQAKGLYDFDSTQADISANWGSIPSAQRCQLSTFPGFYEPISTCGCPLHANYCPSTSLEVS